MRTLLLLTSLFVSTTSPANAQCTEDWSREYFHDLRSAAALLPDPGGASDSVYLAGAFTWVSGASATAVLRFDGETIVQVGASPLPGSGRALCAFNGGIVALLSDRVAFFDGVDWSFLGGTFELAPGVPGFTGLDAAAAIDFGSGEELYVGGFFQMIDGVTVSNFARWDGSSWSAAGDDLDGRINALHVHDEGAGPRLFAGGRFMNAGAVPIGRVARFDGNNWSALDVPPSGQVTALGSWDDGVSNDLIVGGRFNTAGGQPALGIARWSGSSWSALGDGVVYSATFDGVRTIATEGSGAGSRLVVGGSFDTAGGVPVRNVAIYDGVSWADHAQGLGDPSPGLDPSNVLGLAEVDFEDGPALMAIGSFKFQNNFSRGLMKRGDTSWELPARALGLSSSVVDAASWDDGSGNGEQLYVIGSVFVAGETFPRGIARRDPDDWAELESGLTGSGPNLPVAITSFDGALAASTSGDDSGIYVVGSFSLAGGVTVDGSARWDGVTWHALADDLDPDNTHSGGDLMVFDAGNGPHLFAVGHPVNIPGSFFHAGFAAYDGITWNRFDSSVYYIFSARSLATYDDGTGERLYVGGIFRETQNGPAAPLARWNGTGFDLFFEPTVDAISTPLAMTAYDDGTGEKLWMVGRNSDGTGMLQTGVANWDGSAFTQIPSPFTSGPFPFFELTNELTVLDRGDGAPELWVAGTFVSGSDTGGVWRVGDPTALSLQSAPDTVFTARSSDGIGRSVYAGGHFARIEDFQSSSLAERVRDCDTATAYCFGDGGVSPACTPCPCGNDAPVGSGGGCLNSGGSGSLLLADGAPSLSADSLRFEARRVPPLTGGTLFSGSNRLPANPANPCFGTGSGLANAGDGLRCMGGNALRHGSRSSDANGDMGISTNAWGPPSGPTGGIIAQGGFAAGQTRHFQMIHRDDVNAVCGNAVNSTQGLSVTFTP